MRAARFVGRVGAGLILAAVLAGTPALAQSGGAAAPSGKATSGMNGQVDNAGSGSSQGAAGDNIVSTGKGVAGTGMGTMPKNGSAPGTGNSVKGPPGQGINNSTDAGQ